jgi:hypothetical protein
VQNERSGCRGACASGAVGEGGARMREGQVVELRFGLRINNAGSGFTDRKRSGWWVVVAWWGTTAGRAGVDPVGYSPAASMRCR